MGVLNEKRCKKHNITALKTKIHKFYRNLFNITKTDLDDSIVSAFVNKYGGQFGKENSKTLIKGIFNILFQMGHKIMGL
jgi:hypothetical protein